MQLMDLPDEILLEIAARVPFEASTWSNLSQVNQKFNTVMNTKSLPAKAAKIQFPVEDAFVSPELNDSRRLTACKILSEHLSQMAALFSTDEDIQRLIGITILLLYAKEIRGRLLPKPTWQQSSPQDSDEYSRAYYIHLSVFRLLPTDIHIMLRYFSLKVYERLYAYNRVLPILSPEPQGGEEKGKWLCDASNFLWFEPTIIMPQFRELNSSLVNLFTAVQENTLQCRTSIDCDLQTLPDGTYPVLKTDKFLPSAAGIVEAELSRQLYTNGVWPPLPNHFTTLEAENGLPESALTEFRGQMKHTREVIAKIEAPDGQYVRNLLDNLDLKSMFSIVVQQANHAFTLSGDALQEALATEVQLLTE